MFMYLLSLSLAAALTAYGWLVSPWLSLFGAVGAVLFLVSMFVDTENRLWK